MPAPTDTMTSLVARHDWSASGIGPQAQWSPVLRATVDLVLAHGFPMVLLWGRDLIQVYNDGYRVILEDKHPTGLGQPTQVCWPEAWHINGPIYERVWAGETLTFDDKKIPLARHGPLEDAWFTLTYSPVREAGAVAGVLVTVVETTSGYLAIRALREREADLARVQRIGGVGGIDIDVAGGLRSRRSPEFLRLHGLPPDAADETHADWRARVHPQDRDAAEQVLFAALAGQGHAYDSEYRIIRPSDGEVRWIAVRADIVRDASGKALRLVGAHLDITEQKRAQEELRRTEARKAVLLRLSDALRPLSDPAEIERETARILAEQLVANSRAQTEADEASHRELTQEVLERARTAAARARSEQALHESERRLQTLVEGVPQLVWRAARDGQWTWASPQWSAYTGDTGRGSIGLGWIEHVHPDDRPQVQAQWEGAAARGEFQAEYRICNAPEGRYRWFQNRATPVRDAGGNIIEWLGTSTDVDDLRQLQERQRMLVAELQHRVRNILSVVRSVFARTMEAPAPTEELMDHFRGRLDSLARTHVVLTQSADGHVDLQNLIRDELLSVGASDSPRLTIVGPDVALSPKAAETIGLAVHELTTNALKYGALRAKGARLEIRWDTNLDCGGALRLDLRWTEQGVPAISVRPARKGFGRELIEEALPYRLGAETRLEFHGGGVCCTISVPLSQDTAPMTEPS